MAVSRRDPGRGEPSEPGTPKFTHGLALDESDWRPWFALGRLEEAQDQRRIAIANYRHSVRLNPPAAEPYLALARLLMRRLGGDDDEEIKALTERAKDRGLSEEQVEAYLARD